MRFWIFPLALGLAGALLAPICFIEGVWPMLPVAPAMLGQSEVAHFGDSWAQSLRVLPVALAVFGAGVAALGLWRRAESDVARLAPNLGWCLLYAAFLMALYVGAMRVCSLVLPLSVFRILWRSDVFVVGWAFALLFNGCAILWAALRTVSTGDVLSPRVLGAKLRRSARIED